MTTTDGDVHVGDIGTSLRIQILEPDSAGVKQPVDVSSATLRQIKIRPPEGPTQTKTATNLNDGTDGWIEYLTASGDIHTYGEWQIQGRVQLPSGDWHTEKDMFIVEDVL